MAEAAADPATKAKIEKRWLALTQSYMSIEGVGERSVPNRGRKPNKRPRGNNSLRLQEISTLLIQEGNLVALYDRVLDAAIELMSADMGSMQTFHPEQGEPSVADRQRISS